MNLILGPSSINIPGRINTIQITSADEMYEAAFKFFNKSDIIVMAAAVADYMPGKVREKKIKKHEGGLNLKLAKTKIYWQKLVS